MFMKIVGTIIGTPGSFQNNPANTIHAAFDGNFGTFFDAPNTNPCWLGMDFGTAVSIVRVGFAPRTGPQRDRILNSEFQRATLPDFSDAIVVHTITNSLPDNTLTYADLNGTARYWRLWLPQDSYGNVSEIEWFVATYTRNHALLGVL